MPRIQHKRGTSANLASVNPTPLAGELVWDSTENAIKIGDGSTAWTSLAYVTATPRTHTHSADAITSGTIEYARLPVGSTSSTVCAGDDARLTDARAPTAHKATHATGGSDALTPADIGAAPAASPAITGNATFEASSGVPVTITNTGSGNSFVVNDASGDTTPFVVDSAGIVGIQNGNPQSVTFQGLLVGAGTGGVGVTLLSSSSTSGTLAFGDDTAGNGSYRGYVQYQHASDAMAFGAAAATRVFITSSGNVGIGTGTSTPASRLEVSGVITVSATSGSAGSYLPSVTFSGDSNTGFGQVSGQSDSASIFTAGHERVRVDSSGNIRVGGVTSNSGVNIIAPNASGTDQAGGTLVIGGTQSTGTGAGGSISFATAGAGGASGSSLNGRVTRLEIKSSGVVRFHPLSADPASGEAGDVYYNSSTNKLRVYNGTSWIDLH